jgi:hypothetical protein
MARGSISASGWAGNIHDGEIPSAFASSRSSVVCKAEFVEFNETISPKADQKRGSG